MTLSVCAALLAGQVAWAAQAPADLTPQPRPKAVGRASGQIRLNLDNLDVYDFANQMSSILGLTPMVLDPAVQGSVNVMSPGPMSIDEIFSLFHAILKSKNAALVRDQGIYQIVPVATALKNNLEFIDHLPEAVPDAGAPTTLPTRPAPPREPEDPKVPRLATHVIRAEFVPVKDLLEPLKLFVTDGGAIITYERQNMMIITDYADNAARILELVRMLDKSFLDPDLVELVKVEYNAATDVADDLKKIFGSSSSGSGSGEASSGGGGISGTSGISFIPIERMNAIFVMAATKSGLAEAKRWISDLDNNSSKKYQTFTYAVKNSTASNIAMMVTALFGGEGSSSESSGTSTSSGGGVGTSRNSRNGDGGSNSGNSRYGSSSSLSSSSGLSSLFGNGSGSSSSYNSGIGGSFNSTRQLGPQLNTSIQTVTSQVLRGGQFNALQDDVYLVTDGINNMLHFRATPADYRYIEETIKKMDILPRQVRIDAQVYEVTLSDDLTYGFRGELEARGASNLTTSGMSDKGLLSISTFSLVGNSRQITLALDALKTKTKVKILEHPSLLAMDGQPAKFQVGAEVPYMGGSSFFDSGSYSSINYRPTGVTLQVLPRISASGSVTLELTQEVSSASRDFVGVGSEGQTPIFQVASVENVFAVPDGETVAIAGLIRDSDTSGRAGVPFLSDIPLVGGLFGATTKGKERTELIILITPHVIKTPDEFQKTTQELRDSLRNVRQLTDDKEKERIKDIEDARKDREKQDLSNIKKIKAPKKK